MNYHDRTQETTTTAGTGTITLLGASAGYQAFQVQFTTGQTQIPYCLLDVNAWEVGYGTLVTATTLSRDIVLASSNANALLTLSGGSVTVFNTYPAMNADWPTVQNSTTATDNIVIGTGRQLIVKREFKNLGIIRNFGELCIV